jgi:site-specific DNA-methyltransferase (adenine-specific)
MRPYYEHAGITIYHGDCREVLPTISADCCISDPPYGVNFRNTEWDHEIPEVAPKLPFMFPCVVLIVPVMNIYEYPQARWVGCWHREAATSRSLVDGFNHWTPLLFYGEFKLPVDSISLNQAQHAHPKGFPHPTPKPMQLMFWLVQMCSSVGETVVDPFMGSGTTLRAAKEHNRKAIGIEIEEQYCEIAAERLRQEVFEF